jgi:hypothetical protein
MSPSCCRITPGNSCFNDSGTLPSTHPRGESFLRFSLPCLPDRPAIGRPKAGTAEFGTSYP